MFPLTRPFRFVQSVLTRSFCDLPSAVLSSELIHSPTCPFFRVHRDRVKFLESVGMLNAVDTYMYLCYNAFTNPLEFVRREEKQLIL